MKRRDAWKTEEDILLLQTVISYISKGKTQLDAFEYVGEKLNRSAAAVGFRWNGKLRAKFDNQIREAKNNKKNLSVQRNILNATKEINTDQLQLNQIIYSVISLNDEYEQMLWSIKDLRDKIDSIDNEIKEIKEAEILLPSNNNIDLENLEALKKIVLKTTELLRKETKRTAI